MPKFVKGQKVAYVGDYETLQGKVGYVVEPYDKCSGVLVAFEGFTEGHSDINRIPGARNLWYADASNLVVSNPVPVKYPPGTKVRVNKPSPGMKIPYMDGVIVCRDRDLETEMYLCNFDGWGRGHSSGRNDFVADRWFLQPDEFEVVEDEVKDQDVAEDLSNEFTFMAETSSTLDAFDSEVATRIVSYLYARYA